IEGCCVSTDLQTIGGARAFLAKALLGQSLRAHKRHPGAYVAKVGRREAIWRVVAAGIGRRGVGVEAGAD
ncbi:MAG: hypothetical protein ACLQA5_17720, partial [Solirubrobacteraceae bacterium]